MRWSNLPGRVLALVWACVVVATSVRADVPSQKKAKTSVTQRSRPEPHPDEELSVPGFLPSVVSRAPQDEFWILAAHGAGDTPRFQCAFWRELVGPNRGIILCPAGRRIHHDGSQGYYFPDHRSLEREVLAATLALEQSYELKLSSSGIIYAAYSQGATMGVAMLTAHGKRFPRLLLVEGGFEWTARSAHAYRGTGGEKVSLVCGTLNCYRKASRAVEVLGAAQVPARLWYDSSAGHTYTGAIAPEVAEAFAWLLDDATTKIPARL
jgi:predicted esterase